MDNVIFWSGGKDSTATIILAYEHNIPVKDIVFVEVMYDKKRNISGENPEAIKWIYEKAIPKIESLGYHVTVLRDKRDFLDEFNHVITRGPREGKKRGYLIRGRCSANRDLKMGPIGRYRTQHKDMTELVGIAIDEPIRLARLKNNQKSLLAEYGIKEIETFDMCRKYNLLNPLYKNSSRGGCWFCPNCKIKELSVFRKENPELWKEFSELPNCGNVVGTHFKPNKTIEMVNKEIDKYDRAEEFKKKHEQLKLFD